MKLFLHRSACLLVSMLAASSSAAGFQGMDEQGNLVEFPRVRAVNREGRTWFDVKAQNASALRVVKEIGRISNREIFGLAALSRPTLVTVDMQQRPLEQVLEYMLGSLGLRYELQQSSITLFEDVPASQEEQLDLAAAAWMRAAHRFPDYSEAAHARLAQGEIAERKGLLAAARNFYLSLIEDYPNSGVLGEAYMRAGRISSSLGEWSEASRLFRSLSQADVGDEYLASARLEWARAMIAQGDPTAAIYMLNALETYYPALDRTEVTARKLVRARALNETERYVEALEEIDLADEDFDNYGSWEALHIRAVALEGIGLPSEAARAWLLYARDAKGHDKAFSYEQAARLSLEAEDELAVLFIVQQAGRSGVTTGLEHFERQARQQLGLTLEEEAVGIEVRLSRALSLLASGDYPAAAAILEPLYLARGALDAQLDARVCVGWATCIDQTVDLRAAIDVLSEARPTFADPETRQLIDIGAARLYEAHDRFDDAIDAYQGVYAQP